MNGDDPLWRLLDEAVDKSNPQLLSRALGCKRRHPALDNPIMFLGSYGAPFARRAVTAHGLALWRFFSATQIREWDAGERATNAAEVCRALIAAKAPLFSAAVDTGLEDDPGFALQLFVRRVWPPAVKNQVESLFMDYATASYFNFETVIQPEDAGTIGGLLPFDAAIRLGNAPAAAAAVKAGCRTDHIAVDSMGRSIDLIAYIMQTAKMCPAETAASVAGALMDRAVKSAASYGALEVEAPAARRRRGVVVKLFRTVR